jgi:hypothetical protein
MFLSKSRNLMSLKKNSPSGLFFGLNSMLVFGIIENSL